MKIIRWFLSHFFLILLIVVVIYGYMFWGNLLGDNTPAGKAVAYLSHEFVEVEEFVNAVKAKQAKLSAEKQTVPNDTREIEVAAQAIASSAEDKPILKADNTVRNVERNIKPPPVSISYRYNQMQVRQSSDGRVDVRRDDTRQTKTSAAIIEDKQAVTIRQGKTVQPPVASGASTVTLEQPSKFVPEKVGRQLENIDINGNVIDSSKPAALIRDSWITARKSFYQRNYKLSEQSYRDVIANTTDNFDAYGELGNVYFNQGKKKQAASAYYEAAVILVRKGQLARAKSLIGLLNQLDKDKAADLQKLLAPG